MKKLNTYDDYDNFRSRISDPGIFNIHDNDAIYDTEAAQFKVIIRNNTMKFT